MSESNRKVLLKLYNMIWIAGRRPVDWSKSIVIPIPKVSVVQQPSQTRPINLINTRI